MNLFCASLYLTFRIIFTSSNDNVQRISVLLVDFFSFTRFFKVSSASFERPGSPLAPLLAYHVLIVLACGKLLFNFNLIYPYARGLKLCNVKANARTSSLY